MQKTQTRNKHHSNNYDLHGDIARIRAALTDTTRDMRGRAGEILSHSFDNAKEKSAAVQESVSDYVTEKPFKSLGVALLAGLIVGFILRKK